MGLIESFRHDQIDHGVAQELQPLIGGALSVASVARIAAVGPRLEEQALITKPVPDSV